MTNNEQWTIRKVVAWSANDFKERGVDSPRLDAELLVGHALGLERVQLYMDLDRPLTEAELVEIRALVLRRRKREPVAYILGRKEFYGRNFSVSKDVLIPRPETELLVECVLADLDADSSVTVADLGTGSGAIGLTLLCERPQLKMILVDVSRDALAVSRKNAEQLASSDPGLLSRAEFVEHDLLKSERPPFEGASVWVSNPPYLEAGETRALAPELSFEPLGALESGPEGLDVIRSVLECAQRVGPERLYFEIGMSQAAAVKRLGESAGFARVEIHKDLSGKDRVVVMHRTQGEG